MRQLGHHCFEHDPGRNEPGQQEARAGFAPRHPDRRRREARQDRPRPERHPEQQQIKSRRRAMRLLPAGDFFQHVMTERLHEKAVAGFGDDGDEPRQHQNDQPDESGERPQLADPAPRAIGNRQCQRGQADEHQDQRAFDQNAAGQSRPQDRRYVPANVLFGRSPRRKINPRHRAHRRHAHQQQHGVGLGQARLDAEQDRTRHHQGGQQRGAPRNKGERCPISQQHAAGRAEKRRQAVKPDRAVRLGHAKRLAGFHRDGLHPVNADRLLVADFILEADVDIVAALDHLLGRLGKARLVAVDRRDLEKARQEGQQAERQQQQNRAAM